MKKHILFAFATICALYIMASYSSGPAANNVDRTGRTGANCGSCHSGGNYGTTAQIEVLDNGSPVTTYIPGTSYTLRVTYSNTLGNPAGFGSQTVAVLPNNTTNAGSLSNVVTPNTQISSLGGRSYLEQQQLNSNGIFEATWTAPSAGSGTVTFYSSGHAANGSGTGGDDATATTLTLSEGVSCTPISANETITDVSVNGASDGSISVAPSNGTAPYTYNWSNSATTSSISGLSAGTYNLTITDDNACSDTFSFVVNQPPPCFTIQPNESITNVSVFGGSDGSISVSPSNGYSPYSFAWSTGNTSNSISNLSAGTYSLTITDSNSCVNSFSFSVTQPQPNFDGLVDTLFGDTGRVGISFFGGFHSVLDAEKINENLFVILSESNLLFVDSNAVVDSSFGTNGVIAISGFYASELALASNFIYVSGSDTGDIQLQRYSLQGVLDLTYGNNGLATINSTTDEVNYSMIADAQGNMLIAGRTVNNPNHDFMLSRWTSAGVPDSSFGTNGFVYLAPTPNNDEIWSIGLQSDGKIIAAGESFLNFNRLTIARFNTDGSLDLSFGTNGYFHRSINNRNTFTSQVQVLADNSIVATGNFDNVSSNASYVVKLTPNGALDNSFAGNGEFTQAGITSTRALLVENNGKLLLGGQDFSTTATQDDFISYRLLADGSIDSSWGGAGFVRTDFYTEDDGINAFIQLNSGAFYAIGTVRDAQNNSLVGIAKYANTASCDTSAQPVSSSICQGDSLFVGGAWRTTAGIYLDTFQTAGICDSLVATTLTLLPTYFNTFSPVICAGDSFVTAGGNSIQTAQLFYDTLQTLAGCDSVFEYNLSVNPVFTDTVETSLCSGSTFTSASGVNVTTDTVFMDTLSAVTSCDSIIRYAIIFSPTYTFQESLSFCNGDSVQLSAGYFVSQGGTYVDSLQTVSGCDSIFTATVAVNPTYNDTNFINRCSGNYILPTGDTVNTDTIVSALYSSINSCDSLVSWSVSFTPILFTSVSVDLCPGEFYVLPDGDTAFQSATIIDTLTSNSLCDSIITTQLTIRQTYFNTQSITLCEGDSALLPSGMFAKADSVYTDSLTSVFGCDSVWQTTVSVLSNSNNTVLVSICQGDSVQLPDGSFAATAGTYIDTLSAINGCDSVIETQLSVLANSFQTQLVSICENDSFQLPDGNFVSVAGTYFDTLTNASSCDSVIETTVTVNTIPTTSLQQTICAGDTAILPNGQAATLDSIYTITYTSSTNCDSIVEVTLTVNPSYSISVFDTICSGESYLLPDGSVVASAGIYRDTLQTQNFCDSIIETNLSVIPVPIMPISASICAGDSFLFGGVFYQQAGVFSDTLQGSNSCDSVVSLTLSILPAVTSNETRNICQGDFTQMPDGTLISTSGSFDFTFTGSNGCDSVHTIEVVVNSTSTQQINDSFCRGDRFDFPDGTSTDTAGTYNIVLANQAGCDSLITYTLAVDTVDVRVEINQAISASTQFQALADTSTATFNWLNCTDNFAPTGETSSLFSANANADFAVEVTQFGCVDTSICNQGVDVSVKEWNAKTFVRAYPNPNSGWLTLEIANFSDGNVELEMTDITGKVVLETNRINCGASCEIELDLSMLENGVYFLTAEQAGKTSSTKIILQR